MYSYNNRIIGNHSYRTRTGYALMQSKYLTVTATVPNMTTTTAF